MLIAVNLHVGADDHIRATINLPEKAAICKTCSNYMHMDCVGRMMVYAVRQNALYKCPCCRARPTL